MNSKSIATMKKMIKNLMLVAVAAMAFVACSQEYNEINISANKTTIEFIADIENETRSQFGEKEGDYYTSTWTGDETAKFNVWKTSSGNLENAESTIQDGRFSVDFNTFLSTDHIIDAYSPAASWGDISTTWNSDATIADVKRSYTIPSEQNPTANSVDEKAHILKATASYDGSSVVTLNFEHQVAYGKLSFKNLALEEGDSVSSVVLDIDGKKYTINTTATEGIWFACEPTEAVSDMTVSVNTANDKGYTKAIVTAGNKTLAFTKGGVSTFTVNMDGIGSGAAADTFNPTYTVDSLVWNSSGYFNLTGGNLPYPNMDYIRLYLNDADRPNNNSIKVGTYTGGGSTTPTAGKFACRMSLNWGDMTYPSAFTSESTLVVEFVNNEYRILITHNNTTYGYKGMPDGWVAPSGSEGGDEQPETPVALETPSLTVTASGNTVTASWNAVTGAANYSVTLNGEDKGTITETSISFSDLAYSTNYTVTVVANPADSTANTASAAATATVTTEADPNPEEEDEPVEPEGPVVYEDWAVSCSTDMKTMTFTGTNGDTIKAKMSSFGLNKSITLSEIEYNETAVEGSGTLTISMGNGNYIATFEVTIGNITYKGAPSFTI